MKRITRNSVFAGLLLFLASGVGATAAAAAIDMTGEYVPIEFPTCRWTIVQTGTDLQITVTCEADLLWSGPGTVDPLTGAFTATSTKGRCPDLVLEGTADGYTFSADGTLPSFACAGPMFHVTGTKCLNGILDPGEECQDGNVLDGDCCSAQCRFESNTAGCDDHKPSGLQTLPDGSLTLINKPVGAEQWSITQDNRSGAVTGNVLFTDGREPQFILCNRVGDDGNPDPAQMMIRFSCSVSNKCTAAQCPGQGDWTQLPGEVTLPGSFFLPRTS